MTTKTHAAVRNEVVKWLASLPRGEFLRVIGEVISPWTREGSAGRNIYALALVDYDFGGEPGINLVAQAVEGWEVPMSEQDESFREEGQCPHCQVIVVCVAKRAYCPVCHTQVECT